MVDRTFKYILEDKKFKTLGAGRTDALVSANEAAIELFLHERLENLEEFLELFNHNLPQDIRALSITEVDASFNIIQDSKIKEYLYVFAHGGKFHPFCAPLMTTILDELNIADMKKGARLFEGRHNFKPYCYKATDKGHYTREVLSCKLQENDLFKANFFPKESYILKIKGKGFMRNQIRLMMGALIKLGRGEMSLKDIRNSLKPESNVVMDYIAPASGLILNKIEFD
jgi:tRNA pseudouridine38-40 synthase